MAYSERWQKLDMSKNVNVRAQRSRMTDSSPLFEAGGRFPDVSDRISRYQSNTLDLQDNWDNYQPITMSRATFRTYLRLP